MSETGEIDLLKAENERLKRELEEAVNWNHLVDKYGLDQFDALADHWLKMEPIHRVHNAVASVFSKWANDALIDRFKEHMSNSLHVAFVEGCLVGLRHAEAVNADALSAGRAALGEAQ